MFAYLCMCRQIQVIILVHTTILHFFPHVDDGSSSCCCWTNNEMALTLLRLDKEYEATGESSMGSKKTLLTKSRDSNSVKLDKILQQHGRIVVRNCGSTSDASFQDIIVGSNKIMSSRDEDFLKLSILNACSRSNLWVSFLHKNEYIYMEALCQ